MNIDIDYIIFIFNLLSMFLISSDGVYEFVLLFIIFMKISEVDMFFEN